MRPLFFLDEPQYHHLPGSGSLRFRGAALAVDGPLIETLRVVEDGRVGGGGSSGGSGGGGGGGL
jgi:hypothetical protein